MRKSGNTWEILTVGTGEGTVTLQAFTSDLYLLSSMTVEMEGCPEPAAAAFVTGAELDRAVVSCPGAQEVRVVSFDGSPP